MTEQSILVTGAGSGIGRAVAERFAGAGWLVGAYDLAREPVDALAAEFGADRVIPGVVDVTDPESVAAAVNGFAERADGRLDCVINNAGLLTIGRFAEIDGARHAAIANVNFQGVMQTAHAAHPHLARTQGACLINLASGSADYGVPDLASYSASKFAVRGFTEALNLEWRANGIYVCDIMPPFVRTPLLDDAPEAPVIQRMGVHLTPDDVAAVAWRASHNRGRRKVHWPVSAHYKLLYYAGLLLPTWLKRLAMRGLSGH